MEAVPKDIVLSLSHLFGTAKVAIFGEAEEYLHQITLQAVCSRFGTV
ncbi:hypothetical protein HMPREF0648_1634 [Prevotella bivia JCVIHMP010]|nr:hypothetical protein HMPREF0648_1634 [Prevotella bivia JCVIHMP010]